MATIIQPLQRKGDLKWVMTSRSDESSAAPVALGDAYATEAECVAAHQKPRVCSNCAFARHATHEGHTGEMYCCAPRAPHTEPKGHIRKDPHPRNQWLNAWPETIAANCGLYAERS